MSQTKIHFQTYGPSDGAPILWAHGWGQNHKSFEGLIQSLEALGQHIAIDFPGFGESEDPPAPWGTEDYADALAAFIKAQGHKKLLWVGHSFGCRVGLQIAARHPELISGLALISAAGLPRKRSPLKALYFKIRIAIYKMLKALIPMGLKEDWLRKTFGSADYQNTSGVMRTLFVKVVNEDLSTIAKDVKCPVTLIYGENDSETPPDMGQRFKTLIPDAQLHILSDQDHYSVLGQGRHQVTPLLKNFIQSIKQTS